MMTAALDPVSMPGAARVCPVCGGGHFEPMFRHRATASEAPAGSYRMTRSTRGRIGAIERCRTCGVAFLPPQPAALTRYVESSDEVCLAQADARIRNATRLLQSLPRPTPGMPLLDVGAGYGFLMQAARSLGYNVAGIEPSRAAAEHAQRTYDMDVCCGPVEQAQFAPTSFDVVTIVDVIEHLADPEAALRLVHRWLRPAGRLMIVTPDLGSPVARTLGRHWWGLLDDHYFYFSRATLARLLGQIGFSVERMQSVGRSFPLNHWIFKLSQYHAGMASTLNDVARALRLAAIEIPINVGDQLLCLARRR